jgi:hypothetical protein
MTNDERRALLEAMRIQEYRRGWNDAQRGRIAHGQQRSLMYVQGYRDAAKRPTR